jgi:predicted nucleic-acid-binding protein
MIGLDTNVLVRFLVADDADQAARAARLIEERCTGDDPGFVDSVVLCEIVWVLESAYGYARPLIAEVVEKALHTAELEIDNAEAAWAALRAYRTGNADFADAFIGRLNRAAGCAATATFDRAAAALDDYFEVP